jgi:hypothetical protein
LRGFIPELDKGDAYYVCKKAPGERAGRETSEKALRDELFVSLISDILIKRWCK